MFKFRRTPKVELQPCQVMPAEPPRHEVPAEPYNRPFPRPTDRDPFFGQETIARICSRYIAHTFHCSVDIPQSRPNEKYFALPLFIALAIHRATEAHVKAPIVAMMLICRYIPRQGFVYTPDCAAGHALFITVFMIATKIINGNPKDYPGYVSWSVAGQDLRTARQMQSMEKSVLQFLSGDLQIQYKKGGELAQKFEQLLETGSIQINWKNVGKFEKMLQEEYGTERRLHGEIYPLEVFVVPKRYSTASACLSYLDD